MKPIFLIGYMGCGKSTLGRKLALRLGVPFFDTDTLIEEQERASITDIFCYEGEPRFRELERDMVQRIFTAGEVCVVSTGGGLPLWHDTMELLCREGYTIYLRRSTEQIIRRLSPYGRQKRPRLRGLNDEELARFMTENMAEREPFYARAHAVVDCGALSDAELVEVLLHEVNDVK